MRDDYLWDRTGTPDKDTTALEQTLGALRYDKPLGEGALYPRAHRPWFAVAAAALLVLVGGGIGTWLYRANDMHTKYVAEREDAERSDASTSENASPNGTGCVDNISSEQGWDVKPLAGAPRCGHASMTRQTKLPVDVWLETDSRSRAEIAIADIGHVVLAPGSRLKRKRIDNAHHTLVLERGRLDAQIDAPPRLFVVETPSSRVVDLGCEYSLAVGERGITRLDVTAGYVMLQGAKREVTVPYGYRSDSLPESGPTVPYARTAGPELKHAVQQFTRKRTTATLKQLLDVITTDADTLTLHELFSWTSSRQCQLVVDRAADDCDNWRWGGLRKPNRCANRVGIDRVGSLDARTKRPCSPTRGFT